MRFPLLAAAAVLLALEACASQPTTETPATAARPATAAAPKPDPEASAYGLFLAGQAALNEGDLDAASNYLSRAATAEGQPSYLTEAAFAAALAAGDVDRAAALAPTGADIDPSTRSLGVLTRGVEALAQGHGKDAYALFTRGDMVQPYRTQAALLAPWSAAAAGDAKNATAEVDTSDTVSDFTQALDRALLYERVGQRDKAEASFKALAAGGDAAGLVSLAYGGFLERRGRQTEALALYQAALSRAPGDPQLLVAEARARKHGRAPPPPSVRGGAAQALVIGAASMMAQKQEEPALAYIRLGLRLDPAQGEGWVILGDLLSGRDLEGARQAYQQVKPGSAEYVVARGKLAMSFENVDDHTTALKLARETAATAPDNRDAQVTLADMLRTNDDYDESAQVLTKLIDRSGGSPDWRLYYLRASAYDGGGQWPKAEADLQSALKLKPDEPELLNFLGYSWIDRGEHLKEAVEMVQRAVDANPQSGAMIDSLGWGYYRLGDYKTAVQKLEQAVSLEPSDPDVNNHLGDAYWRAGRKIEAVFQWRRVLTLDPDDKLKAEVAAKLASPLGPDAAVAPARTAAADAAPTAAPK
jgi:tetratricopeptide (TPR) repeat protein